MKLTENQKQQLTQDYLNGVKWEDLCTKYSTNTNTIHKILNKNNISKSRIKDKSWSLEKQDLLTNMYKKNCTYKEMCSVLKCKESTLTYWVHKLKLPMRGSGKNNNYTNRFLENTPESNYWLGYIFADGNISFSKEKRRGSIRLSSEKEYVVTKFKEWYFNKPFISKSKYKLKDGTEKFIYHCILNDIKIAEWFHNDLGIDNKKHHTLNPKWEINWDIIRGFFDGDGSSAKREWQLKSCSKQWLERIQQFIKSYDIDTTLKISYLDCWGLFAHKKRDALRIAKLMYENPYYCHNYKYNNYEPYISNDIMQTE